MNTKNHIQSNTYFNNQQDAGNVNWYSVSQKPEKVYHGRGIPPHTPGSNFMQNSYPNSHSQSSSKNSMNPYLNQRTLGNFMYPNYSESHSENSSQPNIDKRLPLENINSSVDPRFAENYANGYCNQQVQENPYFNQWDQRNFNGWSNQWRPENLPNPYPNQWYPQNFPHLYPNQCQNSSKNLINQQSYQWGPKNLKPRRSHKVHDAFPTLEETNLKKMSMSNFDQEITNNSTIPDLIQGTQIKNPKNEEKISTNNTNSKIHREVKKNNTISPQNISKDLQFKNRKTFVRTPFLRQKEIDKLKGRENGIDKLKKQENETDKLKEQENETDKLKERENETYKQKKEEKIKNVIKSDGFNNKPDFHEIVPNVREITGGRNTQSNEAIEERLKQRRQLFVEQEKSKLDKSSSNDSYITISSDANDSFKTAMTFEEMQAFQQSIKKKINDESGTNSKSRKNALIVGWLKSAKEIDHHDDCDEFNSDEDEPWVDATSNPNDMSVTADDIVNNIENLVIKVDEGEVDEDTLMRGERLGRFLFQSEEDQDVYLHPLRERIRKDPEWQKVRLSRKGTEVVFSPRHYYLNLPDEGFEFDIPTKKK